MGVEYCLVDDCKKAMLDLGKKTETGFQREPDKIAAFLNEAISGESTSLRLVSDEGSEHDKIVDYTDKCSWEDDPDLPKECECECHKPGKVVMHFVPCCQMCEHCGKRFKSGFESHKRACVGWGLIVGAFYWVVIALDADTDLEWENEPMPARYAGNGKWFYLNQDGASDWPVRWVGDRIECDK